MSRDDGARQELKGGPARAGKAGGESGVLAKIAAMPALDRATVERLQAIIKASPQSTCRKPNTECPPMQSVARSSTSSKAHSFNEKIGGVGFQRRERFDEREPTAFAVKVLASDEQARIGALVRKAVGSDMFGQQVLKSSVLATKRPLLGRARRRRGPQLKRSPQQERRRLNQRAGATLM